MGLIKPTKLMDQNVARKHLAAVVESLQAILDNPGVLIATMDVNVEFGMEVRSHPEEGTMLQLKNGRTGMKFLIQTYDGDHDERYQA